MKKYFEKLLVAFKEAETMEFAKPENWPTKANIVKGGKIQANNIDVNCGLCIAIYDVVDDRNDFHSVHDIILSYKPVEDWENSGWFFHPHDITSRVKLLEQIIEDLDKLS